MTMSGRRSVTTVSQSKANTRSLNCLARITSGSWVTDVAFDSRYAPGWFERITMNRYGSNPAERIAAVVSIVRRRNRNAASVNST